MKSNQLSLMINANKIVITLHLNLLAHKTMGYRVAVGLKRDQAVFAHMSYYSVLESIGRLALMRN